MSPQRLWDDVQEGDMLETLSFPLTVYRLVMAAGANRDFNAIHHNADHARATGAPDMYANNLFLQGMWERCVRDYIGLAGVIRKLGGFRMRIFNTVGDTVLVKGKVLRKWREPNKEKEANKNKDQGWVEFEIWSENSAGISVGPGRMLATMPLTEASGAD